MNERIESLIELSEVWNTDGDVDKCEVDLYKFAQLIIREYSYDCMDVTSNSEHIQFVAKKWGVEL